MKKRAALKLVSRSAQETLCLGRRLGELAQVGDVFLLVGGLGSGKTCLAQGIALGLGVAEHVLSPSFVLIREYRGRLFLYHIDFYRLESIEEIAHLGLEDYIYGKGVCVIEWADKGMAVLPEENLLITIKYLSENERAVAIKAKGEHYAKLVQVLRSLLKMESCHG